jgi:hypothetical protein
LEDVLVLERVTWEVHRITRKHKTGIGVPYEKQSLKKADEFAPI